VVLAEGATSEAGEEAGPPGLEVMIEEGANIVVVGEFWKTRHPRNVKFNKVLETCFSGAGNSRLSEVWNL
jgi:hypothetical protein